MNNRLVTREMPHEPAKTPQPSAVVTPIRSGTHSGAKGNVMLEKSDRTTSQDLSDPGEGDMGGVAGTG
jgi:hypothetical protein